MSSTLKPCASCFRGVAIATRKRLVTVAGLGDVEPAQPGSGLAEPKAAARRILARIADSEYPRLSSPSRSPPC